MSRMLRLAWLVSCWLDPFPCLVHATFPFTSNQALREDWGGSCRYAKEICDSIVVKCMTGRPKTLEKSQAVFLLWVELEASEAFLV